MDFPSYFVNISITEKQHFPLIHASLSGISGDHPVKNVLVIQSENLLEAGLVTLLSSLEGIRVHEAHVDDLPALPASLQQKQPDVLILDETVAQAYFESILPLLMSYPKLRTIVVSLRENSLSVYDKSKVSVQHINDFLTIL